MESQLNTRRLLLSLISRPPLLSRLLISVSRSLSLSCGIARRRRCDARLETEKRNETKRKEVLHRESSCGTLTTAAGEHMGAPQSSPVRRRLVAGFSGKSASCRFVRKGGELVSVRDTRGRQDAESRKGWSLALTLRERRGGVCVHCSWQSRVLRSLRRSDDGKESGRRDRGGYVIPRRLAPRRTAQVGRFLSFAPCRRRQESVRQLVLSMGRARSLIRLLKPVRLFLERCIW